MSMTRRWVIVSGAVLLVSACSDAMPTPRAPGPLDVQLDSGGLVVPSRNQRIDFGRAEAGTVAAVSKLLNATPSDSATNTECGAGPIKTVSYAQGLDLLFQDGTFRGWGATAPMFKTTSGLAPALSRAQLEAAGVTGFQQTTIGTEFEASGVFGLLEQSSQTAKVDLLWAGVSCFFR